MPYLNYFKKKIWVTCSKKNFKNKIIKTWMKNKHYEYKGFIPENLS